MRAIWSVFNRHLDGKYEEICLKIDYRIDIDFPISHDDPQQYASRIIRMRCEYDPISLNIHTTK